MKREINPQFYARTAGVLYLIVIALGIFEEAFVRGRIYAGNAAGTFARLQQMEMLWRTGIAAELLMMVISLVIAVIIYALVRPVDRDLAILALVFNAVAIAVQTAFSIQLVEALFPLGTSAYLGAFTTGQLHAMTALAMKTHIFGFGIALLLFGPFLFVTGYLVARSGYLPKPLGILYQLAGVAYLFNGFALVLAPQFSGQVLMIIAAPAFIGETSFALWLVFKGVQMEKWKQAVA